MANCALLCAVMWAGSRRSEAVPPLVSSDVPTVEKGEFELYLGVQYESNPGSITRSLPTMELNYGISDRQELTLQLPWLSESGQHGIGDLVLETKYVFLQETKTGPGIAGSFGLKVPTASSSRGLGTGAFDEELLLRIQKNWGWFTALGNAGYTFLGDPKNGENQRDGVWFVSLAQSYQVTAKTLLFTEFYAEANEEQGAPYRLAATFGFDQEIVKDFSMQASVGRTLRDTREGGPDLRVYVGFHWIFGAPWQHGKKQGLEEPEQGGFGR
jgi:hypothetical protein